MAKHVWNCPKCGTRLKGMGHGAYYCPKCNPEIQKAMDERMARARKVRREHKTLSLLNTIYDAEINDDELAKAIINKVKEVG